MAHSFARPLRSRAQKVLSKGRLARNEVLDFHEKQVALSERIVLMDFHETGMVLNEKVVLLNFYEKMTGLCRPSRGARAFPACPATTQYPMPIGFRSVSAQMDCPKRAGGG